VIVKKILRTFRYF
jgi:hypothetical protein